jgi:hypothetical protein
MEKFLDFHDIYQRAGISGIKTDTKKRYIRDIFIAFFQLARNRGWREQPQFVVLTDTDSFREQDRAGRYFDVFFDDLLYGKGLPFKPYIIEDGILWPHRENVKGRRHLNAELMLLLSELMTYHPAIKKRAEATVKTLIRSITNMDKNRHIPIDDIAGPLRKKMERFEGSRICYKLLFQRRNIKALLLIDANSRCGQIAAAKELKIPVIELQHGIIGTTNVGYHWNALLDRHKKAMAIPDKILVFGQLWQDMLSKTKFWKKEEIIPVGFARIDHYRNQYTRKHYQVDPKHITILFTTDWTRQEKSIAFWRQFMVIADMCNAFGYKLYIKPHPCEADFTSTYRPLLQQVKNRCLLIDREESTYKSMATSDLHISFASTTLLESVGLGTPTVCLNGENSNGDIHDLVGVDSSFFEFIPHVDSPESFLALLMRMIEEKAFFQNWQTKTEKEGRNIFQSGFLQETTRIIRRYRQ